MITIPYSREQSIRMYMSAPTQSELLTRFYRAYAGWLDAGAPEGIIFSRNAGLCRNLKLFGQANGISHAIVLEAHNVMIRQFVEARRNEYYPFDGNPDVYNGTVFEHSCYLNEHRIKWVREHAE